MRMNLPPTSCRSHVLVRFVSFCVSLWPSVLLWLAFLLWPSSAVAQTVPAPPQAQPAARPAELDFAVVNVPTTRALTRHGHYFRLTHRFTRDLGEGDFSSLAKDLFALDNGAIIGLEYRFGVTSRAHAGVHRSILSKTIQLFGRYDVLRQADGRPLSLSAIASIEGQNNLRVNRQPAFGAAVSRTAGARLAIYAVPMFVADTNVVDFLTGHDEHDHAVPGESDGHDEHAGHDHTFLVGLGGRFRVSDLVYAAGEVSPRIAGHDPGRAAWGVALELATRRHAFQINVTNSFGTTFGQVARGGSDEAVYLGFNLTRRF